MLENVGSKLPDELAVLGEDLNLREERGDIRTGREESETT